MPATRHRIVEAADLIGRMYARLTADGYRGDLDDAEIRRLEADINRTGQEYLRGYPFGPYEKAVRRFYDYYIEKGVKR